MLSEQDTRAVEAMVRCNMELDDLCAMFLMLERKDIASVMKYVAEGKIEGCEDMYCVGMKF